MLKKRDELRPILGPALCVVTLTEFLDIYDASPVGPAGIVRIMRRRARSTPGYSELMRVKAACHLVNPITQGDPLSCSLRSCKGVGLPARQEDHFG
jgi:hypothetical protein